jgi:5-methylcytosine-specific restriction protein A
MGLSDLTESAVAAAIEEFDRLGRTAFLRKYGFGMARGYLLLRNGRTYDSKAIAGVAHRFLPGQMPLSVNDFSGGEATVKKTLEGLGFVVVGPDASPLPEPGDILSNKDIGRRFSVGNMGGMRRKKKEPAPTNL